MKHKWRYNEKKKTKYNHHWQSQNQTSINASTGKIVGNN